MLSRPRVSATVENGDIIVSKVKKDGGQYIPTSYRVFIFGCTEGSLRSMERRVVDSAIEVGGKISKCGEYWYNQNNLLIQRTNRPVVRNGELSLK